MKVEYFSLAPLWLMLLTIWKILINKANWQLFSICIVRNVNFARFVCLCHTSYCHKRSLFDSTKLKYRKKKIVQKVLKLSLLFCFLPYATNTKFFNLLTKIISLFLYPKKWSLINFVRSLNIYVQITFLFIALQLFVIFHRGKNFIFWKSVLSCFTIITRGNRKCYLCFNTYCRWYQN